MGPELVTLPDVYKNIENSKPSQRSEIITLRSDCVTGCHSFCLGSEEEWMMGRGDKGNHNDRRVGVVTGRTKKRDDW